MSSVATTGITVGNPISLAQVLSHKVQAQPEAHDTPFVFVVDGDASERESLELLLCCKGWQPQTFVSVQEFLRHPSAVVPSCLILEVSQDCNLLEVPKLFAVERPEMPIILITPYSDVRMAVEAIKAGAVDFLTKPFIDDLLLSAIRQALERSRVALAQRADMRTLKGCYTTLTRRERQVMALVVSGMLNKQVGGELGISEITVKAHRGQVMQKMKADSFADLVKKAARLGPAPVPKG
jgi:FixJ family two-component response regulator